MVGRGKAEGFVGYWQALLDEHQGALRLAGCNALLFYFACVVWPGNAWRDLFPDVGVTLQFSPGFIVSLVDTLRSFLEAGEDLLDLIWCVCDGEEGLLVPSFWCLRFPLVGLIIPVGRALVQPLLPLLEFGLFGDER